MRDGQVWGLFLVGWGVGEGGGDGAPLISHRWCRPCSVSKFYAIQPVAEELPWQYIYRPPQLLPSMDCINGVKCVFSYDGEVLAPKQCLMARLYPTSPSFALSFPMRA